MLGGLAGITTAQVLFGEFEFFNRGLRTEPD